MTSTLKAVALPKHLLDLPVVLSMVGIRAPRALRLGKRNPAPVAQRIATCSSSSSFVTILYVPHGPTSTLILIGAAYDTNKKDDGNPHWLVERRLGRERRTHRRTARQPPQELLPHRQSPQRTRSHDCDQGSTKRVMRMASSAATNPS